MSKKSLFPEWYAKACMLDDVYQSLPFQKVNLLHVPVSDFFSAHKDGSMIFGGKAKPENVIMKFYLYEMLLQQVEKQYGRYTPLLNYRSVPNLIHVISFYMKETFRSLHYLLAICLRETRHTTESTNSRRQTLKDGLKDRYHEPASTLYGEVMTIHTILSDKEFFQCASATATQMITKKFPEGYSIEAALLFCEIVFEDCTFQTSNFGGKAWANITKVARSIFGGQYSLYVGLDMAFSLSHNCGSIYNKGFLYQDSQSSDTFNFLLDVQRSGQLMNAVNSKYLISLLDQTDCYYSDQAAMISDADLKLKMESDIGLWPIVKLLNQLNPDEYSEPFSFYKMKVNGAVGVYDKEIKKEVAQVAKSANAKAALKAYTGDENFELTETFASIDETIDTNPPNGAYTGLKLSVSGHQKGLSFILPELDPVPILKRTETEAF